MTAATRSVIAAAMIILGALLSAVVVGYAGYSAGTHISPPRAVVVHDRPATCSVAVTNPDIGSLVLRPGEQVSAGTSQIQCQHGTVVLEAHAVAPVVQVVVPPWAHHLRHLWHENHLAHIASSNQHGGVIT